MKTTSTMKKKLVLLTGIATMAVFTAITGCIRNDDPAFYGTISFWNNDVNENIDVTVDNFETRTITSLAIPSYCNNSTSANFYLREGYHSYTAESWDTHVRWNGSFYIETDCKLFELYR